MATGGRLSVPAKLFITLVVMAGLGTLVYGGIHQSSKNIAEFICYLGIAILASRLKVNLPGITGTLSVNFLFILIGVLELSFSETLILGAVSMMAQCLYPDRPRAIQFTFNVCAGSVSTALAYLVLSSPADESDDRQPSGSARPVRDGLLHRQRRVHRHRHLPHRAPSSAAHPGGLLFLVVPLLPGRRGIAGVIARLNRTFNWETSLLFCR